MLKRKRFLCAMVLSGVLFFYFSGIGYDTHFQF
jgi:hypothetical protein